MKRNDIILIIGILCLAGLVYLGYTFFSPPDGGYVTVKVDDEIIGTFPLAKDDIIEIQDTNILEINDNEAKMISADCPDKLCMHQNPISRDGQTIICLPNKVIVQVVSKETGDVPDAISR